MVRSIHLQESHQQILNFKDPLSAPDHYQRRQLSRQNHRKQHHQRQKPLRHLFDLQSLSSHAAQRAKPPITNSTHSSLLQTNGQAPHPNSQTSQPFGQIRTTINRSYDPTKNHAKGNDEYTDTDTCCDDKINHRRGHLSV